MNYQCIRNGEEYLIILNEQSKMLRLNEAGMTLWKEKIDKNSSVLTMVEILMNTYNATEEEAFSAVDQFIEILINNNIIEGR